MGAAALSCLVVAVCVSCTEPAPKLPGPGAGPSSGAASALGLRSPDAIAYIRGRDVVVRDGVEGVEVTAARFDGAPEPAALAWAADGRSLFVGLGLELRRIRPEGGPPDLVAVIRDPANVRVADIHATGDGLVVCTDRPGGRGSERWFRVDAATARQVEIDRAEAERLSGASAGVATPGSSAAVSPDGAWALRIQPADLGDAAGDRILAVPARGGGAVRELAAARRLPAPAGERYSGAVMGAIWSAEPGIALALAETGCEPECAGTLLAVRVAGGAALRLGGPVSTVPAGVHGRWVAFVEGRGLDRTVVVADVVSGARTELGEGTSPVWRPASGASGAGPGEAGP